MAERVPVDKLEPLSVLAEELGVDLAKMRRWSDTDRDNNFPEPVERIGQVKFYLREDVERWVALWNKTQRSKNKVAGNSKEA